MQLFTPAQRSDAAMSVICDRKVLGGGIFMDADTVLLPSFDPDLYLSCDRPVMYATYRAGYPRPLLAFVSRPCGGDQRFIEAWAERTLLGVRKEERSFIRRGRRFLRMLGGKRVHTRWSCLGGDIVNDLALEGHRQQDLILLNAQERGFVPCIDRQDYGPQIVNDYWFGSGTAQEFKPEDYTDGIVALQNSWMPDEIKNASTDDLCQHPSRLGALFRFVFSWM